MNSDQAFVQSMSLCKHISEGDCTQSSVEEHWHRVFSCAARQLGFNRLSTKVLWNELANNGLFSIQTYDGVNTTPEDWLEELGLQVFNFSNRWSLDRLSHCHWLWRQYNIESGKYDI